MIGNKDFCPSNFNQHIMLGLIISPIKWKHLLVIMEKVNAITLPALG